MKTDHAEKIHHGFIDPSRRNCLSHTARLKPTTA
jgi:hypothetical protein